MGRFTRRHDDERGWIERLPEPFTMRDVLRLVPQEHMARALTWLYDAIEHGRVEPLQTEDQMLYAFTGPRRSTDGRLADVLPFRARRAG